MKKTLTIHIAGLIFNIEESAYAKLSSYLDSIKKYFSTYEGAEEITQDIESRIAEKFIEKIGDPVKGIVEAEDVNHMISSMGSVADFEALEEAEDLKKEEPIPTQANIANTEPKKLVRDSSRKALGGVCSGLAHYFGVDVVWVRLAFLVLVFGIGPLEDELAALCGLVFLGYIAIWLSFPEKPLTDDKHIKKFYLDESNKVVFGVASGVASYLNLDRSLVRVLFFIGMCFGIGILLYLVLWIITPRATRLTQRMEMAGQPVTISNIEKQVQTSQPEAFTKESTFSKITMFPFRMIALVLRGIGNVLGAMGPIFKVLIGSVLILISAASLIAVLLSFAAFIGVLNGREFLLDGHQFNELLSEVSPWMGVLFLLSVGIPFLALGLGGLRLLSKNQLLSRANWGMLAAVWGISIIIMGASIGLFATNFSRNGSVEERRVFSANKTPLLDIFESDIAFGNGINVDLIAGQENNIEAIIEKSAQGASRAIAEKNALSMAYKAIQNDSLIIFDEYPMLKKGSKFRNQQVDIDLKIPVSKPFRMTEDFARKVRNQWDTMNSYGLHHYDNPEDWAKAIWIFDENKTLKCINREFVDNEDIDEKDDFDNHHLSEDFIAEQVSNLNTETFTKLSLPTFKGLEVDGDIVLEILNGPQSVEVTQASQKELSFKVTNGILKISQTDNHNVLGKLRIHANAIENVTFKGKVLAELNNAKLANLTLNLSQKSGIRIKGDVEDLNVDLSKDAAVYIKGKGKSLSADLSGNAELDAEMFTVETATAETTGSASAKINASKAIAADATNSGYIGYKTTDASITKSGNVQRIYE